MAEKGPRKLTRRGVLKSMGAAGSVLLALPAAEGGPKRKRRRRKANRKAKHPRKYGWKVSVFRLKTRDTQSCRACRIHHRFVVAISRHHANVNRAHPGCNCPIVRQKMLREDFTRIFLDTKMIRRGVVDLRHLRPGQ